LPDETERCVVVNHIVLVWWGI